jgi:hypothetical protein
MPNRGNEVSSRILVKNGNELRHFCTVVFNRRDGSLYVFPFGDLHQYFYGKFRLPAGVAQQDFKYTDQFRSSVVPKVSVHATGWVQVEESTGANTAGPLYIPELATLADAVIATITVTDVGKLRAADTAWDTDLVVGADTLRGFTALLYLNKNPVFRHRFGPNSILAMAKLEGQTIVVYIGVEITPAMPTATGDAPGFQLLVGVAPTHPIGSEMEMLYIVGQ